MAISETRQAPASMAGDGPATKHLAKSLILLGASAGATLAVGMAMRGVAGMFDAAEGGIGKGLSYAAAMVAERGFMPFLILFGFFLVVFHLVLKAVERGAEARRLKSVAAEWRRALSECAGGSSAGLDDSGAVFSGLNGMEESLRNSRTGRRVVAAARRFHRARNAAAIPALMDSLSESDYAESEASFFGLRYLIWLLPVLGFIGTVIGLSAGIGALGDSVKSASGFQEVQAAIPLVIHNLAIAFDTTLLALILAAVAFAFLVVSQKRDEQLLARIDRFAADEVVGGFSASGGSNGDLEEALRAQTADITRFLNAIYRELAQNESRD